MDNRFCRSYWYRGLICLLVFCITFNCIILGYTKKAEAFVPLAVIPYALYAMGIGGILWTTANEDETVAAATAFYDWASQETKDNLLWAAEGLFGTLRYDSALNDDVQGFKNELESGGITTGNVEGLNYCNPFPMPVSYSDYYPYPQGYHKLLVHFKESIYIRTTGNYDIVLYHNFILHDGHYGYFIQVKVDNVTYVGSHTESVGYVDIYIDATEYGLNIFEDAARTILLYSGPAKTLRGDIHTGDGGVSATVSVETLETVVVPITNYSTVNNSTVINEALENDVAVPAGVLSGSRPTLEDVQNPTVTQPGTDVQVPTGVNDLTLLGKIAQTLMRTLAKIGELTQALTIAITTFFDITIPVNLEPLKVGSTLTTKFPFSLPWDLGGSFTNFSSSSWVPKWEMVFNYPGVGAVPWVIDLSNWTWVANVCKAIELVIFDIGLVYATRKLLGGGV